MSSHLVKESYQAALIKIVKKLWVGAKSIAEETMVPVMNSILKWGI